MAHRLDELDPRTCPTPADTAPASANGKWPEKASRVRTKESRRNADALLITGCESLVTGSWPFRGQYEQPTTRTSPSMGDHKALPCSSRASRRGYRASRPRRRLSREGRHRSRASCESTRGTRESYGVSYGPAGTESRVVSEVQSPVLDRVMSHLACVTGRRDRVMEDR
jgi:hypothetical protein